MTAAVVELTDTTGRRTVLVEQTASGEIQRIGQGLRTSVVADNSEVLE